MNRRKAIGSLAALPFVSNANSKIGEVAKMKIMVTGAHPDDPETGCGGAIANWTKQGHEVVIVYLTRGEAGIEDVAVLAAAAIRTKEATAACKILNARPVFMGQIDGETVVNNEWFDKALILLQTEKPDLLLTHWPIDTHRDHRACSALFYDAWLYDGQSIPLYYYEVLLGGQTQNFTPTNYIDISETADTKHAACFLHKSQFLEDTYVEDHGQMEFFRGMEFNVTYAEGYVKHWLSKNSPLFN